MILRKCKRNSRSFLAYEVGLLKEQVTKCGNRVLLTKNEFGVFHVIIMTGDVEAKRTTHMNAPAARRQFSKVAA